MFAKLKTSLFIASGVTTALLAISFPVVAVQAQSGEEILFQSLSGNYMVQVIKSGGRACSIRQFRDEQGMSAISINYDRFGAPLLTVIVPNYPGYRQGNFDIRFDMSNGAARSNITIPKMGLTNPAAGAFILNKQISRDQVEALLASPTVTAAAHNGTEIISLSTPSALRSAAIQEYEKCKGTIGESPR